MFGLSLTKILVTIIIIVVVWRGFALYNRLTGQASAAGGAARRGARRAEQEPRTVDLIVCSRCGSYVDPREKCECMKS